nr:MetQ/NlpA family ABC transporter substrate-binding protein [Acinetobacter rathckeae]
MQNNKWIFLAILSALFIISCSGYLKDSPTQNQSTQTINLGSNGSDAQIWRYIAQSEQAKAVGLKINVKEINDGVALNRATLDKEIDVNAFQSWGYFNTFNQVNHNQLAAISTTYLEPMGLYSKNTTY